jgi:hypothetical protein
VINQSFVLTKISGVVTDISSLVTDINHAGASVTLDVTDAIFIGTPLPFNALYMRLGTNLNTVDSSMVFSFWDASTFRQFLNVQDGTKLTTKTLSQSGTVQLVVKDEYMPCSNDSIYLSEIGIDGYYDMYWTKISVTAKTSAVNLLYVGQLFLESDNALYTEYPDLKFDQYKKAFSPSKVDFLDQRIIATDRTIAELIAKNVISQPQQFMDWRVMKEAAMHKTAELIYKALGVKYKEDAMAANKSFVAALDVKKFGFGNLTKSRRLTEKAPTGFYR